MILEFWHSYGHALAVRIFTQNHDNEWLHLVLHVVLVVMPALFICIVLWGGYRLYFDRANAIRVVNDLPHIATSDHRFPDGLFQFIKRYTYRNQMFLAAGALLTLPITYASLELPKRIINHAINTENFVASPIALSLNQIDYLLILCGFYLLALILNGILKFCLNYYKGGLAEGLIRRSRLTIFHKHRKSSRTVPSDRLIPIIVQEVEPVCAFSGDSLTIPMLQGGTVLTILVFMFSQNPALGAAAITLLPVQIIVIPRFQRKINNLVRQRILSIRQLSSNIVLSNGHATRTSHKEIRGLFAHLYELRLSIFRTKYMMKALNNFLMNLTPFFFYTIGGYLVIEGSLSLGALVASLASYKDLSSAIRELFTYYQSMQDARIRYKEVLSFIQSM